MEILALVVSIVALAIAIKAFQESRWIEFDILEADEDNE
jgi:hypothetical protein